MNATTSICHSFGVRFALQSTGKSDPFVELSTIMNEVLTTKVIKNNLTPVWDEVKYLPVLEKEQSLRLEMFDYDAVNLAEGLTLKVGGQTEHMQGMLYGDAQSLKLFRPCGSSHVYVRAKTCLAGRMNA
jgi:hypothetical protein